MSEFTPDLEAKYENAAREIGLFQFNHLEAHGKLERELKSQIGVLDEENKKQANLINGLYQKFQDHQNWLLAIDRGLGELHEKKMNKIIEAKVYTAPEVKKEHKLNWKFWK